MIKRVCDRCGAEMALEDSVSCAAGHIIIKTESGDINKDWNCLDLCEECRKSFSEWLGAGRTKREAMPVQTPDIKDDCFIQ